MSWRKSALGQVFTGLVAARIQWLAKRLGKQPVHDVERVVARFHQLAKFLALVPVAKDGVDLLLHRREIARGKSARAKHGGQRNGNEKEAALGGLLRPHGL